MGAEYRPDWTSGCTLLVCAFPNTPKFRQVEADCGTIVSKEWALDDLNKTMTWLESQEEKPEPSELQKIASEGILTCLQDSIAAVKNNQGIQEVTEQWNFVPRVVEELAKLASNSKSHSREKILEQAITCRHVYQNVYDDLDNSPAAVKKQKRFKKEKENIKKMNINPDDTTGYDSDQTIEMTEEEIEQACKGLVSVQ